MAEGEIPADGGMSEAAQMKRCPDCAELVRQEARICRYCRHNFDTSGDEAESADLAVPQPDAVQPDAVTPIIAQTTPPLGSSDRPAEPGAVESAGARKTVSLIVALAGVVVVAIGVFLPMWDTGSVASFGGIKGNSLIQSGSGWIALVAVAAATLQLARSFLGQTFKAWGATAGGIAVIGFVVYVATSSALMTLCPLTATSITDTACEKAAPGLGIYATALGGGLLLVAAALILTGAEQRQWLLQFALPIGIGVAMTVAVIAVEPSDDSISPANDVPGFVGSGTSKWRDKNGNECSYSEAHTGDWWSTFGASLDAKEIWCPASAGQ